jgi:hypothetical protein
MSKNAQAGGRGLRRSHDSEVLMTMQFRFLPLSALLLLGGCATLPTAPGVMVLPGTGKSFDQFRVDDANCRYFAYQQIGGVAAAQTGSESGLKSAAIGTALGAAAGAALGGGRGAAIGAGTGLAIGGLAGAGAAERVGAGQQERYDMSYIQCMYAQGHRVPVWGNLTEVAPASPPPSPDGPQPPPPPPGQPPPPPPR